MIKICKSTAIWLAVFLAIISHDILAETAVAQVPPSQVAPAPIANQPALPPSGAPESNKTKSDNSWVAADEWLIYIVIGAILFGGLVSLRKIISSLSNSESKWSLADALSEEASVASLESDGNGGFKPRLGADGKPIIVTELRASSSRMIAFVGMILILLMFLGFGIFSIYSFAKTGVMPSIDNIVNFLTAGMTLFAPYLVNQFSAIFEKIAPKRN